MRTGRLFLSNSSNLFHLSLCCSFWRAQKPNNNETKKEREERWRCTWPGWLMLTDRWKFSTGSQPEENVGRNEVAKVTRIRLVEWSNQFVPLLHLNNFFKKKDFFFKEISESPRWDLGVWVNRQAVADRVKWPCDAPLEAKCSRCRSHPADYFLFFFVAMIKGAAGRRKWCPICEKKKDE